MIPTRTRRTPDELIADLEAQIERLAERADVLADKRDRLRIRYRKRLALTKLTDQEPEALEAQLGAVKRDTKLIRMALKAKRQGGAP